MSRPIYERALDREVQMRIIESVCRRWCVRPEEMPALHPYDFQLRADNGVVVAAEVKSRDIGLSTYEEIILSKQKVDAAIARICKLNMNLVYIAEFRKDHEIRWFSLFCPIGGKTKMGVKQAGRTDRNDPMDMEDCYLMPTHLFRSLSVSWRTVRAESRIRLGR